MVVADLAWGRGRRSTRASPARPGSGDRHSQHPARDPDPALWWPLGERPGIGTVINVVLIGTSTNVALSVFPTATEPAAQVLVMLAGVVTVGLGSGLYLAADLGPGPRDGLMTGSIIGSAGRSGGRGRSSS